MFRRSSLSLDSFAAASPGRVAGSRAGLGWQVMPYWACLQRWYSSRSSCVSLIEKCLEAGFVQRRCLSCSQASCLAPGSVFWLASMCVTRDESTRSGAMPTCRATRYRPRSHREIEALRTHSDPAFQGSVVARTPSCRCVIPPISLRRPRRAPLRVALRPTP